MPPQLGALIALADELYNHGHQRETLKIIENIYALYDLGHIDKRSDPEPCGGNIEETREGQSGLDVEGRDTAQLEVDLLRLCASARSC